MPAGVEVPEGLPVVDDLRAAIEAARGSDRARLRLVARVVVAFLSSCLIERRGPWLFFRRPVPAVVLPPPPVLGPCVHEWGPGPDAVEVCVFCGAGRLRRDYRRPRAVVQGVF